MRIRTFKPLLLALGLGLASLAGAGDSVDHRVDEARNKLGANRCSDDRDCDGKRTCSPHGWCQGTSRPAAKEEVQYPHGHPKHDHDHDHGQPKHKKLPPKHSPLPDTRPGPAESKRESQAAGSWEGAMQNRQGALLTQLVLQVQGPNKGFNGQATLTSPPQSPDGATVYSNGLIDGNLDRMNKIRFKLMESGVSGPLREFTGKLNKAGDKVNGNWKRGKQSGTFELERTRWHDGANAKLNPAAYQILQGDWQGEWAYEKEIYAPAVFSMNLQQNKETFKGSCKEPNTFPNSKAKELKSAISEGKLEGDGRLSWRKQMDGTDGIKHAILYSGQLAENGRSASGNWQIPGRNRGTWKMNKVEGGAAPLPTAVPTLMPTAIPTAVPTAVPTQAATAGPTPILPPGQKHTPVPSAPTDPTGPVVAPTPILPTDRSRTPQPTPVATSTKPTQTGDDAEALGGPWHGNAHPSKGKGELSPVTLNLVFTAKNGVLGGHGIALVRDGKPRERNVDVMEGSYKAGGAIRFTLHFSEPEEEDLNLNFRGLLHKNEKLIKGDWDHSGAGLGDFELHYQEGGN